MYGIAISTTVALVIVENCVATSGDDVAITSAVIRSPVAIRFLAGAPYRFVAENDGANMPSRAAASADCATMRIQPTSEPAAFNMAASEMMIAADGPSISRATSANGAPDFLSSSFGRMPMITVQQLT